MNTKLIFKKKKITITRRKSVKMSLESLIMSAVEEKKVFIGYFMLCRYLNGRGYIRYGCNAGYEKPYTDGKDRINSCPILCKGSKIYRTKVIYWVKKLESRGNLFLVKRKYQDSKNPNSKTEPHKLDLFVFICLNEEIYENFVKG